MSISTDQVYLLNKMNSIAQKVQLGTLIQNAENVTAGEIALVEGSLLVGNSSGVATALDGKTSGRILVGNGTTVTSVAVSGDITLSSAGVSAIGSAKVVKAMLASGVSASHIVKFAGTFTTAGGDASETITVTGALGTDIVVVSVKTAGVTPRSIVAAAAGTDAIAVTLSGDPSTDHVLQYAVLRATV